MAEILKLKAGAKVPFPEKLYEGFEVGKDHITANIGIDKIVAIVQDFVKTQDSPVFFFLDIPRRHPELAGKALELTEKDEETYYLDGCTQKMALAVFDTFSELLVNDGLSAFGFGNHITNDEIMFGKYNVASIYSRNIEKYVAFLEEHGIEKTERLTTAWDTFSYDTPGNSETLEFRGATVYDIPDLLAECGMYRAER